MKNLLVLLVLFQMGCASKTVTTQALLTSGCPEKSNCSLQIIPQKSLLIVPGKQVKYELKDNPETSVIVYQFRKKAKEKVQDADFREEIIFELPAKIKNIRLTDTQLQNTKMLFGRFCYCPGETGYYPVRKGNLSVNGPKATLDFSLSEVPQITRELSFSLQ